MFDFDKLVHEAVAAVGTSNTRIAGFPFGTAKKIMTDIYDVAAPFSKGTMNELAHTCKKITLAHVVEMCANYFDVSIMEFKSPLHDEALYSENKQLSKKSGTFGLDLKFLTAAHVRTSRDFCIHPRFEP